MLYFEIVEKTNAVASITMDMPASTKVILLAIKTNEFNPAKKVSIASYTTPTRNTAQKDIPLHFSQLDRGGYFIEIWANFENTNRQRIAIGRFSITNSSMI